MKNIIAGSLAAAIIALGAGSAYAEPIEGVWKRPSTGTLVRYAKAGGEFCGTVLDGSHKGKSIGCMSGSNGAYKGKVIALDEGKTYTGKAQVTGNVMKLQGCVFGFCKGEDWQRQ
ncbi:MAG: hypothetical protein BroJett030_27290 [Alphaproteobacteria bacterium]|nr:MAG: hypothetical protein BroJett030_27290 [Alphaproteobacteria bacterium]